MKLAHNYETELKYGAKILPSEIANYGITTFGNVWWVDGDNGVDTNNGQNASTAFKTISHAVSAASAGDTVLIKPLKITALSSDPVSYTDNVVIPNSKPGMSLIGVSGDITQGGLPQIKVSAAASPIIQVKAPGCTIANLGIDGSGGTASGLVFWEDNGTTAYAFGGSVLNCHFKNCRGTSATDSTTGGAVYLLGTPWQMRIAGNVFYKNVGGIVGRPSYTDVQDIVIEDNVFSGTVGTVDSYIYLSGTTADGVVVRRNIFASVLPNLSSGAVKRYVDLTGCTGIFTENYVCSTDTTSGWGAARAAGKIPTTVGMPHNYSDAGLLVRQ
jgi:hypothetical protein